MFRNFVLWDYYHQFRYLKLISLLGVIFPLIMMVLFFWILSTITFPPASYRTAIFIFVFFPTYHAGYNLVISSIRSYRALCLRLHTPPPP